jgi:glycosyltransferase involved in cell wall biosynthesis
MARVSIVMPAYNAAAVIDESVGSVLAQGYTDWELIVGDDASTDDTAARLEAYGERVRVVRAERNGGPAAARNLALRHAGGELVAFLDADDRWLPHYLETLLARYDAEPGVGLLACDAYIETAEGRLATTYSQQFRRGVAPITLERILRRDSIYVSAMLPRAAGEAVGWFSEDLFGTEDHDLWIKVLERGHRAVYTPEPLCVYRRTEGSISLNVARQAANNQKTYRAALARGRLTARQRRIAYSELRYNRAMEVVARVALDGERSPRRVIKALPLLTWVAATRPSHWGEWLAVLR